MLSVVVPMKNERENVRPFTEAVRAALEFGPPWECVIVDDGSTDGTYAELARIAAEDPRFRAVRLWRNFGQSAALQAGFDHAVGNVIATIDGDLQNDPADLPMMLETLDDGYDVVLGQRANRQDGFLLRKLPSRIANWIIRRVLGVPFRDFGCTLRVMKREVVDGLSLYGETHRFITAFAVHQGARVTQVPVRHHPRTAGKSKYTIFRTVRVILDLLTVKFLASYQTRPMHLFGLVGLGLMFAGTVALAAAVGMKYTSGPGMTSNPLTLLGLLAEVCGVQFLSLGLMGEVMTRVYFESQGKRPYRVREIAEGVRDRGVLTAK